MKASNDLLLVVMCLFASIMITHQTLDTRGANALDTPGQESTKFSVENKHDTTKSVQIIMKLNKTLLSMETQSGYNKYIHNSENSNLAEFRYYKSCISVGLMQPYYTIDTDEDRINVILSDTSDPVLTYNFKLDKIEVSPQEKIGLMLEAMNKDILDLKDKLWFLDPSINKISKGRFITSKDPKMIDFIEGKSNTYSGIYNIMPMANEFKLFMKDATFLYCEEGTNVLGCKYSTYTNPLGSYSSNGPILVRFPRAATVKKLRLEIANGPSCPYNDTIKLTIKRYFIDLLKPLVQSGNREGLVRELDNPVHRTTNKKLDDGFVEYEIDSEQYSVTDCFVLFISTNGFRSPSNAFDGACNYKIRNIALI